MMPVMMWRTLEPITIQSGSRMKTFRLMMTIHNATNGVGGPDQFLLTLTLRTQTDLVTILFVYFKCCRYIEWCLAGWLCGPNLLLLYYLTCYVSNNPLAFSLFVSVLIR